MDTNPIKCEICGEQTHSIELHLKQAHKDVSLTEYKVRFPTAPLLSEAAKARVEAAKGAQPLVANHAQLAPVATVHHPKPSVARPERKAPMHEVFSLPDTPEVRNGRGEPIMVTVCDPGEFAYMVPAVDKGHVFNAGELKNMLMAIEMNMTLYVYGHKGTGKTTDFLQICARTGRPVIRVQHTMNTEESQIVGQWAAANGSTYFNPGPLTDALKHGWVYLADEYDFGLPSVLSTYQSVLEGEPLVIKDADPQHRVVKPHPQFRFFANGNTNGAGDETGLYAGTNIQNSANYDRFAMMLEKKYMDSELETKIIENRSGISAAESKRLVGFANDIRKQFDAGKISDTISTRSLVNIAHIGLRRSNMKLAIALCFSNKLNKTDRAVVEGFAQRLYG